MTVKLLILFLFILFNTTVIGQKISSDTLLKISQKVFIYTSKETQSDSSYDLAINYKARFNYNHIYIKTNNNNNYCHANYSSRIKRYIADAYQEELQKGISVKEADSLVLYELTQYAGNYHRDDFFYSWGVYDKLSKFDKLQGKYHYIDYHTAYKKKIPIYRKNDWKRDTEDSIEVYDCSIERYLLVDSVIYLFTSSLIKPHRNRKRGLKIVERDFKKFVQCIWVKEEEGIIEK